MSLTGEQRARLQRAKLSALVRDHLDVGGEPFELGSTTALSAGDVMAVLVPTADPAALAGALLGARRRDADTVVLYVDEGADDVARWAGYFALPGGIQVRAVAGAGSVAADPSPVPPAEPSPDDADDVAADLRDAGVELVVEHGVLRGEVWGLEVARAVRWPTDRGGDGRLHLEAGVGRFDRDAVAAARPDDPPAVSLRRAVDMVREHRYPGAPVHPLQLLARERWLRAQLVQDPSLVGATELHAVATTIEAPGLKDAHPAAASGVAEDGSPMLVLASTGVDLALVPLAADTRAQLDPAAELVLAVPPADRHPGTVALATMLRRPATVVAVEPGWG